MDQSLLNVIQGYPTKRMPLWLMRQAGRYLPEYRYLRSQAKNFLELCLHAELAAEITLQPIRRFDLDAAIVFADILLVPMALGQGLEFRDKEGPFLESIGDVGRLVWKSERIRAVYETLERVKKQLPPHVACIGFAGGLWTVACYMVAGRHEPGFVSVKAALANDTQRVERLFAVLHDATVDHLVRQVRAGAQVVQVFDSWAGILDGEVFERWIVQPTQRLVAAFKEKCPDIPVIGFPRGCCLEDYERYISQTGIQVCSLDPNIHELDARDRLKPLTVIQGNLDPQLLVEGGLRMERKVVDILEALGPRHIMNLGHGVLPQTPVENVDNLIRCVRAWEGK